MTNALIEKHSHDLIKSMVNLIQFSKETSRSNLKLSLVLEIFKVCLYWDIIRIIRIFDLKNELYVDISMESLYSMFSFLVQNI